MTQSVISIQEMPVLLLSLFWLIFLVRGGKNFIRFRSNQIVVFYVQTFKHKVLLGKQSRESGSHHIIRLGQQCITYKNGVSWSKMGQQAARGKEVYS